MDAGLRHWAGLARCVAADALEEVVDAGDSAVGLNGIKAEVFEHAIALVVREDEDTDARRPGGNLTRGNRNGKAIVPEQGADTLEDLSHTGVGVAGDTKADHALVPRPNAELTQIIQQVSLAAVFFDLDVGQPQVSAQGIEEEHFVPAFTDQHFGLVNGVVC